MLGLGADRKVLRDYLQRRLRIAGAHTARARYSRGVRPAQEREREADGARAPGAARDGDDGVSMETVSANTHCSRCGAPMVCNPGNCWCDEQPLLASPNPAF